MSKVVATASATACRVELMRQTSFSRCALDKSFGCTDASTIWVSGCRGKFRCGAKARAFRCGYPPGQARYECACSSGERRPARAQPTHRRPARTKPTHPLDLDAEHFRSLTPYFHTADADALLAAETTPRFTNATAVREWQRLTRARLRGVWASERPLGSCAVVGSSAALLTRRLGAEIDAHDVVIRANQALVRGLEAHVGKRTDLRVWGFVPLPREKRYSHAEWAAEDNYIIYCPPIKWAGYCWNQIAVDADPRFHPSAWRRAQRLIHTNRTRCAHVGCYPSTGAMAVLHAVDRCQRVTVYGFGTNEAGVAPCERPSAECLASKRRGRSAACRDALTCEVGTLCQKYTPRLGEPSGLAARAAHCRRVVDGGLATLTSRGKGGSTQYHGKADYFAEAAAHHDVVQEWAWLERLQRRGALVWRGQPGVAPESDGHRHRMEP